MRTHGPQPPPPSGDRDEIELAEHIDSGPPHIQKMGIHKVFPVSDTN